MNRLDHFLGCVLTWVILPVLAIFYLVTFIPSQILWYFSGHGRR